MNADTIEQRVAAGKAAREVLALAENEGGTNVHFWEVLRDGCIARAPLPTTEPTTSIRPMDDAAGTRYGREVMGFGVWVDCTYEHVYVCDAEYLRWLADKGMALLRWLRWRETKH
jgi:hypothetical protein